MLVARMKQLGSRGFRAARGLPDVPQYLKDRMDGYFDTRENRLGGFQYGRAWESCMILSPVADGGGWSYRPAGKTRTFGETIQLKLTLDRPAAGPRD